MNIHKLNSKALTMCLTVAIIATYSMSALASPPKVTGELLVSGKTLGDKTAVKINGNTVENGSIVFSSSTIKTPSSSDATINLGKAGKVQLAPNTKVTLSFDNQTLTGKLSAGEISLLSPSAAKFSAEGFGTLQFAANSSATLSISANGLVISLRTGKVTSLGSTGNITVKTAKGNVVTLGSGEAVNAIPKRRAGGGKAWWLWAIVFGGAAAGIILAADSDNNRIALGGGGTVISPNQ